MIESKTTRERQRTVPRASRRVAPSHGAQSTILIAEDHEDTRRVYSVLLRHHGYRVVEAASGEEALARTHQDHPALVLMDLGLPGMDGRAAAEALKADEATRCIPVIAFSALVASIGDLRAEASHFDGFIAKPVSPLQLVRRIGAYLQLVGEPARPASAKR